MCIFCRIVAGEIPAQKVCEDERWICIKDINPAAAVHLLVIPKAHYSDIVTATEDINGIQDVFEIMSALPKIVETAGISDGFRIINNCREKGGQTVMHLHFHVLGGEQLTERIL